MKEGSFDALTKVIIVGVVVSLGLWWLNAGQPGKSPKNGEYDCLTAESFERKLNSAESGVPFTYDPRESSWSVSLSGGEVTQASEFRKDQKSGAIAEFRVTDRASSIEKLSPTSFTMTIDGALLGCELHD